LFAFVSGGIIFAISTTALLVLFFYGMSAAGTEGISKAWISNIVPRSDVATAIGFYTGMQSICTLIASSEAGWLWYAFSPAMTFGASAVGAILTIFYLMTIFLDRHEWSILSFHYFYVRILDQENSSCRCSQTLLS
jgi:MFS family permease